MSRIQGSTRLHTTALSGSLTITNDDDSPAVLRAAFLVASGTCAITGNFNYKGQASTAITLSAGQADSISALSAQCPLDGITITASGGVTNVMLSF